MKIKEENIDGITVIYAEGNFDLEWGAQAKNRLCPMIEDPKCKGMVLDFSAIEHVDSSGLSVMVSMHKTLTKHSKKFVLSGMNDSIKELLRLTRLDEIILTGNDIPSSISIVKKKE